MKEKSSAGLRAQGKSCGLRKSSKGLANGWMVSAAEAAAVSAALSWVFFGNLWAVFITAAAGVVFFREQMRKNKSLEKRKRQSQCKDALLAVAASLAAGNALENAITSGSQTLRKIWGEGCALADDWENMESKLRLHIPVETVFMEFAGETGLSEMDQLAGLIKVAKRSGGGLANLIKTAAVQMEESIWAQSEIQTKLTEKRMELYIMMLMPPGILVYLRVFSYDIISPLYEQMWGHVFMCACLAVYAFSWCLGMRFLDIEV